MKSISLFVLFWASINIHAVDNLRIPDIRSLGMGGSGVTQSVLFNPALVALNTDKVLHLELIFDDLYYCLSMIYKNNGTNIFCQSMMQNLHFEW